MESYYIEGVHVLPSDLGIKNAESSKLTYGREITALKLLPDGKYLAIGDKTGRVVVRLCCFQQPQL